METVEGTLTAALVGDRRFCLIARVPVGLTASWPRAPRVADAENHPDCSILT